MTGMRRLHVLAELKHFIFIDIIVMIKCIRDKAVRVIQTNIKKHIDEIALGLY